MLSDKSETMHLDVELHLKAVGDDENLRKVDYDHETPLRDRKNREIYKGKMTLMTALRMR